ncbi:MAG: ABC transporter ATP-binding protein [Acutalibacteraceae bacterium]|nr:ABC transporter ATP-binding protein [Acutalibacteraceae bacterium]
MSVILNCQNITKKFGNVVALNNVSLSIESGKIVGLLGPNGSGKTTLIKLINGLLQANNGNLTVCGHSVGVESKKLVSYLPDTNYLSDSMSVKQVIELFEDFYDDFRTPLAFSMLEKLGIDTEKKLKTLSKGNKEKVCLILVMSRNAQLYVLDEPIAGVDPATRDYIISTIINNYNPESSVIISTHLISDIEEVLDDVIFIKQGSIILHKPAEEIREENGMSVDALFREAFKW